MQVRLTRTTHLLLLGSALGGVASLLTTSCGGSGQDSDGFDSAHDASSDDAPSTLYGRGGDAAAIEDTGADAGNSDAATGDAHVESDAAPKCGDLAYCDDFEGYDAGKIANGETLGPWTASVMGVTVTIDSIRAYKSKQSLHVTVPKGPTSRGTLDQQNTAGLIPGNNMFGRAMVYYADNAGNRLPLDIHSWIFNSSGPSTANDGGGASMNMGGGGAKLQLNYHPPLPATEQSIQGGTITAGAWHCIQWQYDGSGREPSDTANVWIDGKLAVSIPANKGWRFATPWTAFDFGFTHYQSLDKNTVDVFLDDFALGGARIACP